MEFFRKYQRPILFTAGIFALVTFSMSAALYEVVGNFFTDRPPLPTVKVEGRTVELQPEDNAIALKLTARGVEGDTQLGLLPRLSDGERDDTEVRDTLAALRRIAIELGIEASRTEVEKAIEKKIAEQTEAAQTRGGEAPTREQIANFYGGEREMQNLLFEALRIGTLVRLQSFGVDTTDHGIAQRLAKQIDLVEYSGVLVSADEVREELEAEFDAMDTEGQDRALREYLDGLDYDLTFGYRDQNKHRVELLAVDLSTIDEAGRDTFATTYAEQGGLEAGQTWKDSITDDEVESFLTLTRFYLYPPPEKKDGDGEKENGDGDDQKPGEEQGGEEGASEENTEEENTEPDPDEVRFRIFVERVLTNMLDEVRTRLAEHMEAARPEIDALETALAKARLVVDDKNIELAALREGEDSEYDEEAVEAMLDEIAELEDGVRQAEQALLAKRLEILRGFDAGAAWAELSGGNPSFVTLTNDEFETQMELREFDAVGKWNYSNRVEGLTGRASVASETFHSKSHVFGARLLDRIERPLRELEDIRENLQKARLDEMVTERVDELAEGFENEIDERARAILGESVTEIEDSKQTKIQERFDEWKSGLEADLAAAEQTLQGTQIEIVINRMQKKVDGLKEQLEKADDKREEITTEVEAEIEEEVDELIAGKVREVFKAAAEAAGLEIRRTGLLPKDLSAQGRSRDTWDPFVAAIFYTGVVNDIDKVEEVTDGFVRDNEGGSQVWAELIEKKEGTIQDVTIRRLAQVRNSKGIQRGRAIQQSFSLDALRARWGYEDRRTDPPVNSPSN